MNPKDVRAFVGRDWAAVAESKRAFWAEQFRTYGHRPAWEASNGLVVDMRALRTDFPTSRDRERDLADHERMSALLARVAHVVSRRAATR